MRVMKMKTIIATTLFASLSLAHSGVWNIEIDGIKYGQRLSILKALLIFCFLVTLPGIQESMGAWEPSALNGE
jgi:hypothetical protein